MSRSEARPETVEAPPETRRPLRVLRISTDTYPDIVGGGALHAHDMSRMQADAGHEILLLTSDHGDRSRPREEERAGYTVRRYREWTRPFGNSITPGLLRDLPRLSGEFDVVHAHSHLYFSSNVAAAVARATDTPFVLTNHGLFSQTAPEIVQRVFVPTVARFTFNSADRILCYTETDARRLEERGITAPISVIHNGIDCSMFRPRSPESGQQILFVGRLKEAKGVHWLVEAFGMLGDEFPDATLKIVGEGPLRPELEQQCRDLGIGDRVTFAGHLENDELPDVYSESAVFALPSLAEGLPRTVLEALACETPVVTSELPQLEPLVDGVGRRVPKRSPDELGEAIATLLRDETKRAEMGERGRKRVVENYSWEETVRETTGQYYRVLDESGV